MRVTNLDHEYPNLISKMITYFYVLDYTDERVYGSESSQLRSTRVQIRR